MAKEDSDSDSGGRDGFQSFIKQYASHAVCNKDEEYALIRAAKRMTCVKCGERNKCKKCVLRHDPAAMSAMIKANVKLLLSLSIKYSGKAKQRGIFLEDLFNVAAIGLQKGVLKFETDRDLRLSTYATWWIRHEISRYIEDCGTTIRIPVHSAEKLRKIARVVTRHRVEFGVDPDVAAISRLTGLEEAIVLKLRDSPTEPYSLDISMTADKSDGGNDCTLLDLITDIDDESPEDRADMAIKLQRLEAAKERVLTQVERDVLHFRLVKDITLVETAARLARPGCEPLSRERIRQIEDEAKKKLKRELLRGSP